MRSEMAPFYRWHFNSSSAPSTDRASSEPNLSGTPGSVDGRRSVADTPKDHQPASVNASPAEIRRNHLSRMTMASGGSVAGADSTKNIRQLPMPVNDFDSNAEHYLL